MREVEQRYPDEMQALADGQDIPLGGGETHAEFSERIDAALEWLCGDLDPGQRLLVVCHGGVIGAALSGFAEPAWPLTLAICARDQYVDLGDRVAAGGGHAPRLQR